MTSLAKPQWGDEDEGIDIPPTEIFEDEKTGIKTMIEYKLDANNTVQKVTTKYQIKLKTKRVSKSVASRAALPKFGRIATQNNDFTTILSKDELKIEDPKDGDEAEKRNQADAMKKLAIRFTETNERRKMEMKKGGLYDASLETSMKEPSIGGAPGKYVAPGMRGAAGGGDMRDENPNTLRVTNISEDATENDLKDLFKRFGPTSRVFLVKNKETGNSRGFAYVSYLSREDAEKAMRALNGYGYDHLILKIEWAAPSQPREFSDAPPAANKHMSGYGRALPQG
ncbi:hypothetical protein BASA81_012124 [Batrachochytrium salamandrivorans]|nr:hypothetical protein BASA81_012124 [Batrachochytrium salamandrivorans]